MTTKTAMAHALFHAVPAPMLPKRPDAATIKSHEMPARQRAGEGPARAEKTERRHDTDRERLQTPRLKQLSQVPEHCVVGNSGGFGDIRGPNSQGRTGGITPE